MTVGEDDFVPVEAMDLAGGHPSLDFVNTASRRDPGPLREKLRTFGDLVTWAERVGTVPAEEGARLREQARDSPGSAEEVLERARALREAIFRLFARPRQDTADLGLVALEAGQAAARRILVAAPGGYEWAWEDGDRVERVLWPVALGAAELLTSEDRHRVKECAADGCNWLFLDQSRNRSRRWCDMKVCGNRAKARRFTQRHRSS